MCEAHQGLQASTGPVQAFECAPPKRRGTGGLMGKEEEEEDRKGWRERESHEERWDVGPN